LLPAFDRLRSALLTRMALNVWPDTPPGHASHHDGSRSLSVLRHQCATDS